MNFIVCGWQVRSLIIRLCTLFWFNIETFYWKTFVLDWIQVLVELRFDVQFRLALFSPERLQIKLSRKRWKGDLLATQKRNSQRIRHIRKFAVRRKRVIAGNTSLDAQDSQGERQKLAHSYCQWHFDCETLKLIEVFERGNSFDSSLVSYLRLSAFAESIVCFSKENSFVKVSVDLETRWHSIIASYSNACYAGSLCKLSEQCFLISNKLVCCVLQGHSPGAKLHKSSSC